MKQKNDEILAYAAIHGVKAAAKKYECTAAKIYNLRTERRKQSAAKAARSPELTTTDQVRRRIFELEAINDRLWRELGISKSHEGILL